jgi:hypothetical protein
MRYYFPFNSIVAQPFGGEKIGTVTINSDGNTTNVVADINASPQEGNVFEGWFVDAGGSGYKLSLGQFRGGNYSTILSC